MSVQAVCLKYLLVSSGCKSTNAFQDTRKGGSKVSPIGAVTRVNLSSLLNFYARGSIIQAVFGLFSVV